jgi:uncharacterized Zn finger protein (UPF0148 family)
MKVVSIEESSRTILLDVELQFEVDGKIFSATCQVTESIQGEPETTNYAIGCVRPKRFTPLVLRYRDQIVRAVSL